MKMKLSKSLAELDQLADNLLAKSMDVKNQDNDDEPDDKEGITPEEISDDSTASKPEDAEGADTNEDENEKEGVKKSCSNDLKKSDEEDENEPVVNEEDEELEKSEEVPDENTLDEDETPEENEENPDDINKSLMEDFESEDAIKKGMEGSEFYSALVEVLTKSLGDVQYDTHVASKSQETANEIMAKSMCAIIESNKSLQRANELLRSDNDRLTRRINKLEKSITQGFDKVMDTLDEISSQPAHMRKSLASISVQDRNFDKSINGTGTVGGFESLSKAQVLTVLNNELYAGNANVTPSDIISYESGAPLRQDLQTLVANKCK